MNGHSHEKRTYKSARPPAQGSGVVRANSGTSRATRILACCDTSELQQFLVTVVQMGFVLSITATSDGGAVSITCFDGAIRYKSYARHEDELPLCYRDLLAAIRGEE